MDRGHRQKLKSGDEVDAITPWRRLLRFRAGERKKVKKALNKRLRKNRPPEEGE